MVLNSEFPLAAVLITYVGVSATIERAKIGILGKLGFWDFNFQPFYFNVSSFLVQKGMIG